MLRTLILCAAVGLAGGALPAQAFQVCQDPDPIVPDCAAGQATIVDAAPPMILHLVVEQPGLPSADPNVACSGAPATGAEVCGWDLHVVATGGAQIDAFAAAPGQDIIFNQTTGELRGNGGDPILGETGDVYIGDLTVEGSGASGTIEVTGNLYVTAQLTTSPVPGVVLAALGCAPGDDTDGDGICNAADLCPSYAQLDPAQTDTNGDGIPDECQCGDVSGEGVIDGTDVLKAQNCFLGLASDCDPNIADTDNSGGMDGTDVLKIQNAFLGLTNSCSLTCLRSGNPDTRPACP